MMGWVQPVAQAAAFPTKLLGIIAQQQQSSPNQITIDFSNSPSPQKADILSVNDVIKLAQGGISDDVIIMQIKKRLQPFDLTPDQLLQLKAAHVSDRVINAMVGTTAPPPPPQVTTAIVPVEVHASAVSTDTQPLADGFYYRDSQGWKPLEPISMTGGGLKHVGKMLVPGLTPQIVWTFRGAQAPVEIREARPTFCIKELPSLAGMAGRTERDVVIVRFDKKADHRELQTTNGGNMFTFKSGLSKDRTPDITVKAVADGEFTVTPNEDLKPGEYLLTFSALGASGYDFGIAK
jgi:hypothetical protein